MVLTGKIESEVKTFRWESGVILHEALVWASYISSLNNRGANWGDIVHCADEQGISTRRVDWHQRLRRFR